MFCLSSALESVCLLPFVDREKGREQERERESACAKCSSSLTAPLDDDGRDLKSGCMHSATTSYTVVELRTERDRHTSGERAKAPPPPLPPARTSRAHHEYELLLFSPAGGRPDERDALLSECGLPSESRYEAGTAGERGKERGSVRGARQGTEREEEE